MLLIPTLEGMMRFPLSEIRYIESQKHYVIYHLQEKTLTRRASLTSVEKELNENFVRCNNCYIVNLYFVQSVKNYTVIVDGEELLISQPRKKKFLQLPLEVEKLVCKLANIVAKLTVLVL